MTTVILVANKDEASHIQDLVFNSTPDHQVSILITGEGRTNVIRTVAEKLRDGYLEFDDKFINVGYVGAKGINKGTVAKVGVVEHLIPSKTIKESCIALNVPKSELECYGCFTADNFVDNDSINPDMPNKFVCDMELYYLVLMLPEIMSIKIVSDTLDYDEYKNASFDESWEIVKRELKEMI